MFPKIEFPSRFLKEAKDKEMKADTLYALKLLQKTGICVVPGSGFGQKEDTWHFRATILPLPENYFVETFDRFREFHNKFMEDYHDEE